MQVKILEVRDEATFLPVLCIDMNPGDDDAARYLLRRCGYPCTGEPNIAFVPARCDGDKCTNDPFAWGDRTRNTAHAWIIANWGNLKSGDVVDVSYILGETAAPKVSERVEAEKWLTDRPPA